MARKGRRKERGQEVLGFLNREKKRKRKEERRLLLWKVLEAMEEFYGSF